MIRVLENKKIRQSSVYFTFFVLCLFFASCASTPPGQTVFPVSGRSSINDNDFKVVLQNQNPAECRGADGTYKDYFLGSDGGFNVILTFFNTPPENVKPENLKVGIAHMSFPFAVQNDREFLTRKIWVKNMEDRLNTGETPVFIYYNGRKLGKYGMIAIDNIPPAAPELRVENRAANSYMLAWDHVREADLKEYRVQKWENGDWNPTEYVSMKNPPIHVREKPEGRIRVEATDCVGNKSHSREIILNRAFKSIRLRMKGKMAYLAADLFKSDIMEKGFTVYEQDEFPEVITDYQAKIKVRVEGPVLEEESGLNYWEIKEGAITLTGTDKTNIRWNLDNARVRDKKIWGKRRPYPDGPDSFTVKIADPLVSSFFEEAFVIK